MGTVFKKTYTKPVPDGLEYFKRKGVRYGRWKDANGSPRIAKVITPKKGKNAGHERLLMVCPTYIAKYRDGSGHVQEIATGCKDETAARNVLADLERKAELVRSKVITSAQASISNHQDILIAELFDAYIQKLESEGTVILHRENVRRCLDRVARECRFTTLADLRREGLEKWLVGQQKLGMGARTRNLHRSAIVAFCNWCIETDRLSLNPFTKVAKADEIADPRRKRRALTEDELQILLSVASERLLREALTIHRGKHKGQLRAKISDSVREKLIQIGRERALIYKTLVLTGLRKSELASITIGQVHLSSDPAYLILDAGDEKNRQGSTIPLRSDLAEELKAWISDKATSETLSFTRGGRKIASDTKLFNVPEKLVKIMDKDLLAAGLARLVVDANGKEKIDKRDERGRTIDVHALRTTFATMLSKSGVAPRTAQAAMRHSSISLTMNTYTDPKLLDVAGAVEALPALSLTKPSRLAATGTDDAFPLVPLLAPITDKSCHFGDSAVVSANQGMQVVSSSIIDASGCPVTTKEPLTSAVSGSGIVEARGVEPLTPSLQS